MHEALENNFDWILPKNPFYEYDVPEGIERGHSETYIDKIQCIVKKTSDLFWMLLHLEILDSYFLRLAERR